MATVPSPSISRKVEQAAIAYIATLNLKQVDGTTAFSNIYSGKSSMVKSTSTTPSVFAYAESAKFDDNYSGNAHVTLHIITKYPMAVDNDGVDPVVDSDSLTSTVFNAFHLGHAGENAKVADQLNLQGIADFTALTSTVVSEDASAEEGSIWTEKLTLDIYAAQVSGV